MIRFVLIKLLNEMCINYLRYYIITLLYVLGYPCPTIYRNLLFNT